MPVQTVSEVLLLGPCQVLIDSVDMGYNAAAVKVTPSYKFTETKVGKFGDAPMDSYVNMTGVDIEVEFAQTDWIMLSKVYPAGTKVTSGLFSKLTLGLIAGTKQTPFQLKLVPLQAANATPYGFTGWRVVSQGSPEIIYDGNTPQVYKVKLKCLVDDTKSDGNWFGTFGDTTINADVTPPTISSVTPADAATGVALSSTVVWVASKALDVNTITNGSVSLQLSPVSVGTPTALAVPGNASLSADGLTITFTPTSNLTVSKTYIARLSTTIKDLAGNRLGGGSVDGLAGYLTDFAT